jgi:4-coumarate--CoA ligase
MITHTNICSNVMQQVAAESGNLSWKGGWNNEGDKILAFLPFFHIYGELVHSISLCSHLSTDRGQA